MVPSEMANQKKSQKFYIHYESYAYQYFYSKNFAHKQLLYVRVFCDIIWICSDSTFVVFDGSPTPRIYNHNENKFWKS